MAVGAGRAELTHGAADAIEDHTPILGRRKQIGAPTASVAYGSPAALLTAHPRKPSERGCASTKMSVGVD